MISRSLPAAAALAAVVLWCPDETRAQAAIPLPLLQGSTVVMTLSFLGGERVGRSCLGAAHGLA